MLDLPLPLLVMTAIGIVAFAASGAVAGARAGMDWFGLAALAAVTAIGGGTLRDVLMTQTPGWLIDFWPTVALIAITVVTVWIASKVFPLQRHRHWMSRLFTVTETMGLADFTAVGTHAALDAGFGFGPALILGGHHSTNDHCALHLGQCSRQGTHRRAAHSRRPGLKAIHSESLAP